MLGSVHPPPRRPLGLAVAELPGGRVEVDPERVDLHDLGPERLQGHPGPRLRDRLRDRDVRPVDERLRLGAVADLEGHGERGCGYAIRFGTTQYAY